MQAWAHAADEENVVVEPRPHDDAAFAAYLRWYLPRTRARVTHVPAVPPLLPAAPSATYPVRRDQNFDYAVSLSVKIIFVSVRLVTIITYHTNYMTSTT